MEADRCGIHAVIVFRPFVIGQLFLTGFLGLLCNIFAIPFWNNFFWYGWGWNRCYSFFPRLRRRSSTRSQPATYAIVDAIPPGNYQLPIPGFNNTFYTTF